MTTPSTSKVAPAKAPTAKAPAKAKLTAPKSVSLDFADIGKKKPTFLKDGTVFGKSQELLLQTDTGAVVTGFVYEYQDDYLPKAGSKAKKGDLLFTNHYGVKLTGIIGWAELPV